MPSKSQTQLPVHGAHPLEEALRRAETASFPSASHLALKVTQELAADDDAFIVEPTAAQPLTNWHPSGARKTPLPARVLTVPTTPSPLFQRRQHGRRRGDHRFIQRRDVIVAVITFVATALVTSAMFLLQQGSGRNDASLREAGVQVEPRVHERHIGETAHALPAFEDDASDLFDEETFNNDGTVTPTERRSYQMRPRRPRVAGGGA